jgi:hypothetical protein
MMFPVNNEGNPHCHCWPIESLVRERSMLGALRQLVLQHNSWDGNKQKLQKIVAAHNLKSVSLSSETWLDFFPVVEIPAWNQADGANFGFFTSLSFRGYVLNLGRSFRQFSPRNFQVISQKDGYGSNDMRSKIASINSIPIHGPILVNQVVKNDHTNIHKSPKSDQIPLHSPKFAPFNSVKSWKKRGSTTPPPRLPRLSSTVLFRPRVAEQISELGPRPETTAAGTWLYGIYLRYYGIV